MTAPDPNKIFRLPIQLQDNDFDALGHINNVVYLRWVQEAAAAHWQRLAPPGFESRFIWVVLRHEIDYIHPIVPGTKPVAQTWVGAHDGARSVRWVTIGSGDDQVVFARARTTWCLLNAGNGKPARITPELQEALNAAIDQGGD